MQSVENHVNSSSIHCDVFLPFSSKEGRCIMVPVETSCKVSHFKLSEFCSILFYNVYTKVALFLGLFVFVLCCLDIVAGKLKIC